MKNFFVLALVFLFTACSHQIGVVQDGKKSDYTVTGNSIFVLGGLGQFDTIDAAAACGGADKVVQVRSVTTFWNTLAAFPTLGIIYPRAHRVECLGQKASYSIAKNNSDFATPLDAPTGFFKTKK